MTTETLEAPETTELQDLTGKDRCDRCPSQAYVRVALDSGELTFCGHHYAKNEAVLIGLGAKVLDRRERLLPTPADVEATELA